MMSGTDAIRGIVASVPTPFGEDGSLDEELFARMIEHYVERRANALFVLGPFGQGPAMDVSMRRNALEIAVSAARGKIPVMPDVGAVDPYNAGELGRHARECGVEAIAVSAPYYYSDRSPEEIVLHFRTIDEQVGLPMLIVNNQRYQGYPLAIDTTARIRDAVPHLFGIHPSHSTLADVLRYRAVFGEEFKIFSTPEALMPGILLGQSGTSNPMLSMCIEAGVAFMDAIDRDDLAAAREIHLAILQYLTRMSSNQRWYRSVHTFALRYIGFPVKRFPRWPTLPLPSEAEQGVSEAIDELQEFIRGFGQRPRAASSTPL